MSYFKPDKINSGVLGLDIVYAQIEEAYEKINRCNNCLNYLIKENFDDKVEEAIIIESINVIEKEIKKQIGKHEAVTHYMNEYEFVPPFVLTKILTFGELSRLYAMLKQSDRQSISKNFKLSDNF